MREGWVQVNGYWMPFADPHLKRVAHDDPEREHLILGQARWFVKDWSVAIDGGAHVGVWASQMAKRFGKVYAVEIAPDMAECLRANTEKFANVEVINAALGNASGTLGWEPDDAPDSSVRRVAKEPGEIPVLRIDDLQLPSLGLLKLDLQGYDFHALKGAEETLKRCRPVVVFEWKERCAKRYGVRAGMIEDFLKDLGAEPKREKRLDNIWVFP